MKLSFDGLKVPVRHQIDLTDAALGVLYTLAARRFHPLRVAVERYATPPQLSLRLLTERASEVRLVASRDGRFDPVLMSKDAARMLTLYLFEHLAELPDGMLVTADQWEEVAGARELAVTRLFDGFMVATIESLEASDLNIPVKVV